MSNVYGYAGSGGAAPSPPGKVNFGWIGEAWNLFGAQVGIWVLAAVVAILLPLVLLGGALIGMGASLAALGSMSRPGSVGSLGALGAMPFGFIAMLLVFSLLYQPFIYGGLFRMGNKQARGEPLEAADVFSGGPAMLRMLGLTVLIGIVVFVLNALLGAIFSVLSLTPTVAASPTAPPSFTPGMLISMLVMFAFYSVIYALVFPAFAMVADGEGVFASLGRSVSGMGRDLGRGALFVFLFGIIYFLSAIPCGLGLFVTVPMIFIISALSYRDMVGMPGGAGAAQSPYGAAQPGVWPPPPGTAPPPPSDPPTPGNWPPPAV